MIIKARGTVTVPKEPRSIGNLLGFAREVNRAIQQLRDRVWDVPSQARSSASQELPFQVSASASLLKAAPGVIGSTTISGSVLEETSPADGDWYLVAKVTINATTGAITAEEVYWANSVPSNTSTTFHIAIAFVEITAGEITNSEQYNYGPIFVVVGGGATDIWEARIY